MAVEALLYNIYITVSVDIEFLVVNIAFPRVQSQNIRTTLYSEEKKKKKLSTTPTEF